MMCECVAWARTAPCTDSTSKARTEQRLPHKLGCGLVATALRSPENWVTLPLNLADSPGAAAFR